MSKQEKKVNGALAYLKRITTPQADNKKEFERLTEKQNFIKAINK